MLSNFSNSTVDTITFEISPVKIDFRFKQLSSGKIGIEESNNLRNVKLFGLQREGQPQKRASKRIIAPTEKIQQSADTFTISKDSIIVDSNEIQLQDSTELQIIGEQGNRISQIQTDWMVGVLLFALILMAIIRFSFNKFLQRVVDAVINYQTANSLFLEKNMRNIRGSIFMNLLFFVNVALYIIQYYTNLVSTNHIENGFRFFGYSLLGLMGLYAGKFIVIRSIGYIFNGIKESREYWHSVFIYNKNLGMFLLPITLSVPFIAQHAISLLLNAGLGIALIFYLLRLARGLRILFRKHVSIFYMILYLCALEILPLLMIYKLLKSLA